MKTSIIETLAKLTTRRAAASVGVAAARGDGVHRRSGGGARREVAAGVFAHAHAELV